MIGGDFNEILSNADKVGGPGYALSLMVNFWTALLDCELQEVDFVGERYTWSNNRQAPDTVRCRLDRVCINPTWADIFSDSLVEHLPFPGSDQMPILFHVKRPAAALGGHRRPPFRFEAKWIRRLECEDLIRESWYTSGGEDVFDRLFHGVESC